MYVCSSSLTMDWMAGEDICSSSLTMDWMAGEDITNVLEYVFESFPKFFFMRNLNKGTLTSRTKYFILKQITQIKFFPNYG